jgi:putative oxidoreductase
MVLGRCLLALLFLHEARLEVMAYDGAARYSEAHGVPGQLLPAAIALEFSGGLLILVGLATRAAAILLAGFCMFTAVVFHFDFSAPGELVQFEKDLAIAGGFVVLCCQGPGAWSIDRALAGSRRRRPEPEVAQS